MICVLQGSNIQHGFFTMRIQLLLPLQIVSVQKYYLFLRTLARGCESCTENLPPNHVMSILLHYLLSLPECAASGHSSPNLHWAEISGNSPGKSFILSLRETLGLLQHSGKLWACSKEGPRRGSHQLGRSWSKPSTWKDSQTNFFLIHKFKRKS